MLLLVARVAMPLTDAGPVMVTANMGSFSPNPVEVNKPATANLSANYNSPSGVPEGDFSAQYDWTSFYGPVFTLFLRNEKHVRTIQY